MTPDSITVYVRKGLERNERFLSFIIPTGFTQSELMECGWAVDGNQALRSISIAELHRKEIQILEWFRQKGYSTLFC